jgi:hypothetical protein
MANSLEINAEPMIQQAKYLRMLRWCEICKNDKDLISCDECTAVYYCSEDHKEY